jgi:hypothetical protein
MIINDTKIEFKSKTNFTLGILNIFSLKNRKNGQKHIDITKLITIVKKEINDLSGLVFILLN